MLRFGYPLLLLVALALGGCTTPCEELAERRCACAPTISERNACENRAEQQRAREPPTDADEERCEAFLETCDCARLRTAQGKRDCGLAE